MQGTSYGATVRLVERIVAFTVKEMGAIADGKMGCDFKMLLTVT